MNITSKFLYAKTKDAFIRELPNIPPTLNPIVFIEDTKELWTHGTYFSIGYPVLRVTEISGTVKVEIGDDNFVFQTSGSSLSVKKGNGNNIIISSTALSSINAIAPLLWNDITKQLTHLTSGVISGNYGQNNSLDNASIFSIPNITVDTFGHITNIANSVISIRDYVEQLTPTSTDVDRNILLSYNESNNNSDSAQVRKARGLTYNDASQTLSSEGGIVAGAGIIVNNGDLIVVTGKIIGDLEGNVTGQATPKIHLSGIPEYGGASTELYGHVRLQDELIIEPLPSSANINITAADVTRGIAASPKMVWDVKQELLLGISAVDQKIDNKPYIGGISVNQETLEINQVNQNISISGKWGTTVSIENNGIVISSPSISIYDENENVKTISSSLKFSKDFTNNLSDEIEIRWTEI